MSDFKVIPCKSMPIREFILDENRPNQIGIRQVGMGGRYWFDQKHADKEIKNHERQLKFWRELRTKAALLKSVWCKSHAGSNPALLAKERKE